MNTVSQKVVLIKFDKYLIIKFLNLFTNTKILNMIDKKEKIYLITLISSCIILIFSIIFLTYRCPRCNEVYKIKDKRNDVKPIIIYKVIKK